MQKKTRVLTSCENLVALELKEKEKEEKARMKEERKARKTAKCQNKPARSAKVSGKKVTFTEFTEEELEKKI